MNVAHSSTSSAHGSTHWQTISKTLPVAHDGARQGQWRSSSASSPSVPPSLFDSLVREWLLNPVERVEAQPENFFASLIPDQSIAIVPSFTLESGVTLRNVPVAYTTVGQLSPSRDNALVICHALSGSADVADWWGPLMGGPGQAFDVTRFFVICLNSLGSPYGSASPVTNKDGDPTKGQYGPEFPLTSIRDDVKYAHSMGLTCLT